MGVCRVHLMQRIHSHTTNTITSLSPPCACSLSASSCLLCFVRWSHLQCHPAFSREWSDLNGPENKHCAWRRAVSRRCSSMTIGGHRSKSVSGGSSGKILGLGIGPRIVGPGPTGVEGSGRGVDAVGNRRSLPPCATQCPAAAVGKAMTQPICPSTKYTLTWAPTASRL